MGKKVRIQLAPGDRDRLEALIANGNTPQKHVRRARIVVLAGDGIGTDEIQRRLAVSKPTIRRWRTRYVEAGVDGLCRDKTRPPGKAPLGTEVVNRVLEKTLTETPPHATHWSLRTMAKAAGIAPSSVGAIWKAHGLKPHLVATFKLSNDPRLAAGDGEHARYLNSRWTIEVHCAHLCRLIGGTRSLAAIDDAAVAAYVTRRRAHVAPGTVNRELQTLAAIFARARDIWQADFGVMPHWRRHRLPTPEPRDRFIAPAEAHRLIACAADHLKGPIAFALMTGARRANVLGLDWSQIDMTRREITFAIKSQRPGGKRLVLPMSDELFLFLANRGPSDAGPVFTYAPPGGTPRPIKKFRRSFATACRRAGLANLTFHDLRHTFATWKLDADVPLDVVQHLLGHAKLATTQRYAHRTHDQRRAAMNVGATLTPAVGTHGAHSPAGIADKTS